jgi:hypothetical protein
MKKLPGNPAWGMDVSLVSAVFVKSPCNGPFPKTKGSY